MPKYSLTNKGNVVQCKWNCTCSHEHYIGTYERAVKYFGVDQTEIKSYGNLLNIVLYQQTSQSTVPKLSNELYDKLINAQSEHKFWSESKNRHNNAMEILVKAKMSGLIYDKNLYKNLKNSSRKESQQRAYMFKIWCEQNSDESYVIDLVKDIDFKI